MNISLTLLMSTMIFANSNLNFNTFTFFNPACEPWQFVSQHSTINFLGLGLGFYFKLFFILFLCLNINNISK